MMVLMVGVNHRTADLSLREKVAMCGPALEAAYGQMRHRFPGAELVVLSTCNRTELYVARPLHEAPDAEALKVAWSHLCGVGLEQLTAAIIHRDNEQAIHHLFRVASGVDSMVLGETQILGQVRRAYEEAMRRDAVGPVLHKVFQSTLNVARQVRAATGIAEGRVSVASVAVDFARQIFERFDDKVVVGVGAGEMAKLTLRHLRALEPAKLWVTNRSAERAQRVARTLGIDASRGGARPFDDLDALLVEADIVLTGTGATQPIITVERFKPLLRRRRHRPLFIIDIALPRDVDPGVAALSNTYLYNLDDLQQVVSRTLSQRQDHLQQCQALIMDAVRTCMSELRHRDVGHLIRQLRQRLHTLSEQEQQRTLRKLAAAPAGEAARIVEEHSQRLVNKILHLPLQVLDQKDESAPVGFYAAALRRLFQLEEAEEGHGPGGMGQSFDPCDEQAICPPTGQRTHPCHPTSPPSPTSHG